MRSLKSGRFVFLILSTLLSSLTALAEPKAPAEVVYLGDIEGRISRLTSFLENSGAFERVGAQWNLKDGKTLVFSGDAIDRGDSGREVLRALNDLKARYPS